MKAAQVNKTINGVVGKMKPKVKKEWVRQLRSGLIQKGQFQLRSEVGEMCVMGVLCNVHAKMNPKIAAAQTSTTKYMDHQCSLPPEVKTWAGIPKGSSMSVIRSNGQRHALMDLNDFTDATFEEMADLIEKQL